MATKQYADINGLTEFYDGIVQKISDDLASYYTKTQVDSLISAITTLDIEVVQTLPTQDISQTTIYLVPKSTAQTSNTYDEYINTDGTSAGWELIGSTAIDLSGYVQKSQTAGLLKNDGTVDTVPKASQASVNAILDGTNIDSFGDVETALMGKMKSYALDKNIAVEMDLGGNESLVTQTTSNITQGSTAIPTSGAVYTALGGKLDVTRVAPEFQDDVAYTTGQYVTRNGFIYRFKTNHSAGAFNPQEVFVVTIGDVLADKEYITSYDSGDFLVITGEDSTTGYTTNTVSLNKASTPTQSDTKPITSGGVYTALQDKASKDNVIANTKLIKDTVGWSGKNKWNIKDPAIIFDASTGLTYSVLEKGYQLSNSTASEWASLKMITASHLKANSDYKLSTNITITSGTARIIVSGATSQGGTYTNIVDSGNITANGKAEVTFNTGSYTWFRFTIYATVGSSVTGNVKYDDFMIYSADILDSTYEPYFGSTAFPRSEQAVLGAKNICSNIPTFTLLKSGDRTKNNTINETPNIGTYKVSFTISDATNITKQGGIQLGDNAGNWSANPDGAFDVVNGRVVLTIPFAHAVSRVYVFLNANDGDTATATFSDFMITLATDTDPTYAPYAMTNEQLTNAVKNIPTVSVSHTGTASSTGVRKQQITVNNVNYEVDGSAYMEQEVILSTSGTTTVTFTNAIITDGKTLTLETSIWDLVPDDMVTTEGVCTITLPKWSSAVTIGVRLRVR